MSDYHKEQIAEYTIRLRALLEELPYFLGDFFRGISNTTAIKTRVAYAYDLKLFFTYIVKYHSKLKDISFEDMKVDCLEEITAEDIESFLEYITYYKRPSLFIPEKNIDTQNEQQGKSRKLAAIRSMYHFFYKKQKISCNPAEIVDRPKIHNKEITYLEPDEVANLLDLIEYCNTDALSDTQKAHIAHSQKRDLALISLLLGTGIRVSECVGININDIDFRSNSFKVVRKGGDESTLYFNDEVRQALLEYIAQREKQKNKAEKEEALFLSNRGTRITVRAVQNMVKKYARIVSPTKKISPHKLRSTYATSLYHETEDIYLVADALGHTNINTTQKYYAHMADEHRRSVVKYVNLRKNE